MFTLAQIDEIHTKLGSMNTFWSYVKELKAIGIERFDSYLTDGHSKYFGAEGYQIESEPVHEKFVIAENSNRESFLRHLSLHEEKKTDYVEMSRGLAESGIEKWTVDTVNETMAYCDKKGNILLLESNV